MVVIIETKRFSVRLGTKTTEAYDRPMSSEWIERRKKQQTIAAQQQQLQTRHAGVITAKGQDWMSALAQTMKLQAIEASSELGQALAFSQQSSASFMVHNNLVYPAISVVCTLDVQAQCIRVSIKRKESESASQKTNDLRAEFSVNGGDALLVTFADRTYLEPEHLAAHVLELTLFSEHPPALKNLGMS